jgi:serine/threonine protein kinase/Tol biopolymer transport system component
MPLPSGTALGSYEIQSLIGQGGMGEVYRARDTRLKRVVAIKVLPPAFAADPQRMARFQREAEVLASLNHPGIAAIYGLEERALVMELVDGPTLAGPLPIETALNYARQIAEALEYAHERGVMHRDLKPANIKVTPEGPSGSMVKLLDFGLAKAIEDPVPSGDPSESPTLTLGATRAGVILGTASYMSPEQAHGKAADRRADIFSFGAVLYEMLSGKRAFTGESVGDTLASVLKLDPDWKNLPAETPESIRRLLRRCMAKDRKQRLQAIGEARIILENPGSEAEASPRLKPAPPWSWIATTAIAAVVAAVALWGWLKPAPPEPRPLTRFSVQSQVKGIPLPTLSRDGSRIAQSGGPQSGISLRAMDEFEAKLIPGTEGGLPPCFSPDGQWIAFAGAGQTQLKKVPVAGGAALTLADGLTGVNYCDWGRDDNVYFAVRGGIMRVPSSGGKPETLATPDVKKNETSYSSPQLLPDGKQLLLGIVPTRGPNFTQVVTLNLQTKEKKILLENAGIARYAPSGPNPSIGHIVYGHNGSLFAVAFDVNRLQVGSPSPVLDGVGGIGPLAFFGLSDSGTLAYFAGAASGLPQETLVWVDRQGAEQPIPVPARTYRSVKLSPDGGRIVVSITDSQTLTSDIWIYDLARGSLERRTFGGINQNPVWTPDGKRLIYGSANTPGGPGVSIVPADGSGAPSSILASADAGYAPTSISPDGKTLMGTRTGGGGTAVWVLPLAEGSTAEAKPTIFLESKFSEQNAQFSPDGHWVAYQSNESGGDQVYVVPYPGPGGKSQVSLDGGASPHWNRNGRELFFRNGNKMMAVDVQTSPNFHAGTPKMLFETDASPALLGWDVSPDGRRFLMTRPGATQTGQQPEMRVVLNWFEELRRRVPLPK